jgi:hypothetical protein
MNQSNIISMRCGSIEELRAVMHDVPHGEVSTADSAKVLRHLAVCWENIIGSDDQSTTGHKIYRGEEVKWQPPMLTFVVERHGAICLGSSRAELHQWEVNIDTATARIVQRRTRQLYARSPSFTKDKAHKLAVEIRTLVTSGATNYRIKWNKDGTVNVNINNCVDADCQQTQTGRNRQFTAHLVPVMEEGGWMLLPGPRYRFRKSG